MQRITALGILAIAGLIAGCRSDRSMVNTAGRLPPPARHSVPRNNETKPAELQSLESETKLAAHTETNESKEPATEIPIENAKDFAERKEESFAPGGLSPISPALMLEPGPIPKGYDARLEELERVGKTLASASQGTDISFRFDTIYNPRSANTCHTEAGHILVTSSLLERLKTRHQLATALALEMAELVEEKRQSREKVDAARAGVPEGSFATLVPDDRTKERIEATAADLLAAAGFESIDLAAVQQDLSSLSGRIEHASAKPTSSDPKWNGPTSSAAN